MIGIAAVFGAISIFAADFWVKSQAKADSEEKTASIVVPQAPKVEFKTIVVANAPLRYGMALDRAQLSEIPWPQDSVPQGAFTTIEKLLEDGSRVVLSPIEVNEPVLLTKLSGPNGRATLSNMLSPGMRAVTIRTDDGVSLAATWYEPSGRSPAVILVHMLHKSRRDRECVRWRLTKARGRFGCNDRQLFEDKINVGIARWTTRQVSLCLDGIAVGRPIRHLAFVLKQHAGHEHMVL